jgi:hypothetical protein
MELVQGFPAWRPHGVARWSDSPDQCGHDEPREGCGIADGVRVLFPEGKGAARHGQLARDTGGVTFLMAIRQ